MSLLYAMAVWVMKNVLIVRCGSWCWHGSALDRTSASLVRRLGARFAALGCIRVVSSLATRIIFVESSRPISCTRCFRDGPLKCKGQPSSTDKTKRILKCIDCWDRLPLSAFRRSGNSRKDVCRGCELLYCSACRSTKQQRCFRDAVSKKVFKNINQPSVCVQCEQMGFSGRDLKKYVCTGPCKREVRHKLCAKLASGKKSLYIICTSCYEERAHRAHKLTVLMRRSERPGCTCGTKLQHSERC